MGQKPLKDTKDKSHYIAPVPGTHGAPTRKHNHITVYSDSMHVFLYLPVTAGMTVRDIKKQLSEKFGRSKAIRLFSEGREMEDFTGIDNTKEASKLLFRMHIDEDEGAASFEASMKLDISNNSARSAPCSAKDSMLMGSSTPDNSTHSLPVKKPWEIDFSVYALPEGEQLSGIGKKRRVRQLHPIAESGDPCEEETRKFNVIV